jgi:Oxidoreductase molybdopterin binding domain
VTAGPSIGRLTSRQVDVVLEIAVLVVVASGIASLAVGTSWGRGLTAVHGIGGLTILVLAPAKARGSVRTGLRRRRISRWLSLVLAGLVLLTIALGIAHSTGVWFGVGYWSPLWTHVLAAFVLLSIFAWHVLSRRDRPKVADLDRRAVLRAGAVVAAASVTYGVQEVATRALGSAGGDRRFTGSHEVGSFDPAQLPTVSWIDDTPPPSTRADGWRLDVVGEAVPIDRLRSLARPVEAAIDCTGGWWSRQLWDAVPLTELLDGRRARSIEVTSTTGYTRLFPFGDGPDLYLAIGYGGEPLRRGHGAPVRLLAPGRRGPWWVKWVRSVDLVDRPWWLQLPFPLD